MSKQSSGNSDSPILLEFNQSCLGRTTQNGDHYQCIGVFMLPRYTCAGVFDRHGDQNGYCTGVQVQRPPGPLVPPPSTDAVAVTAQPGTLHADLLPPQSCVGYETSIPYYYRCTGVYRDRRPDADYVCIGDYVEDGKDAEPECYGIEPDASGERFGQ